MNLTWIRWSIRRTRWIIDVYPTLWAEGGASVSKWDKYEGNLTYAAFNLHTRQISLIGLTSLFWFKNVRKKSMPGILRLTVYSNPEGQICTTKGSVLKSDQPIRLFILTNKIAPAGRLEISKPTHAQAQTHLPYRAFDHDQNRDMRGQIGSRLPIVFVSNVHA
jgi:hypothetical protein